MTRLAVHAPLDGWVLPLAQVCDDVFAKGLAGDGVAIDPLGDVLHAPFDGEVILMGDARHALSVRHASGIELLMHVGIDTVAMQGRGFERLVMAGQAVRSGDPLLRFDIDRIAREARSAVTPMLLSGDVRVPAASVERRVRVGDTLFVLEVPSDAATSARSGALQQRLLRLRVPFDHGLHARPAAQLVAALRGIDAHVLIEARGRSADARSTVSLMALGVQRGDEVLARVSGAQGAAACDALAAFLTPIVDAEAVKAIAVQPREVRSGCFELHGVVAVRGLAVGRALSMHEADAAISETGGGEAHENAALANALTTLVTHLQTVSRNGTGAQREVLTAHLSLLEDPELQRLARARTQHGASAAAAWRSATRATAATFVATGDARMAERAADLRDLERQVLRVLAGESPTATRTLPDDAVLIADELLPSQLASLDAARIAAICMARGGPTSHVALLAAARGIPTVMSLGDDLLSIVDGTPMLVDAEQGRVVVAPSLQDSAAVSARIAHRAEREATDLATAREPAATRDGTSIAVLANIGAVPESAAAVARGAEGCGLLRTEFLFLERQSAPDEQEQVDVYAAVARAFSPRPVTVRTLDVGGDKPLAYLPLPREENPVLGLRGLRVGLREPALLRRQLRAMLAASTQGRVRIMLPMVNDLAELRVVRGMLQDCARELDMDTIPPLGVMIETPAAALLADQLAREADFLSIGSNDLSQYVLAMDRAHPELAAQLDGLHPAVLRLIAQVAAAGQRAGRSVSVCGGLASDVVAVPLLIGVGIRELSVVPASLPGIKRVIRELGRSECEALARLALDCTSAQEVRALVAASAPVLPAASPRVVTMHG